MNGLKLSMLFLNLMKRVKYINMVCSLKYMNLLVRGGDMKKIRQKATDIKRKIKQKANRHQMKTIDNSVHLRVCNRAFIWLT